MFTKLDLPREVVLPEILNRTGAKVGVEIGVFKGQFTKELMERWEGSTVYMVDPWRPLGDEYIDSSNHANHLNAYQEAMDSIRGYETRAFMLRGLSEELVNIFADGSLDFVYIDGNHAYDYVKQDMELWWPKLKVGGLFAGHDYLGTDWDDVNLLENGKDKEWWMKGGNPEDEYRYAGIFGVNPAVNEFCDEKGYDFAVTSEWTGSWHFIK